MAKLDLDLRGRRRQVEQDGVCLATWRAGEMPLVRCDVVGTEEKCAAACLAAEPERSGSGERVVEGAGRVEAEPGQSGSRQEAHQVEVSETESDMFTIGEASSVVNSVDEECCRVGSDEAQLSAGRGVGHKFFGEKDV